MTEHSFQSRDFTVLHSTRVCLPRARSRAGDEGISPLRWDEICLGFWRCFCFVVTFSCANDQTESPHTVQYIILWVPRSPFFLLIESDVGKGSRSMKLSLSLETNRAQTIVSFLCPVHTDCLDASLDRHDEEKRNVKDPSQPKTNPCCVFFLLTSV
jgi:hypothetical protein